MDHRYVRIEAARPTISADTNSSPPRTVLPVPKRRRTSVAVACDECRRRKIRVSLSILAPPRDHAFFLAQHVANGPLYSVGAESRPILHALKLGSFATTLSEL
jgi:hypothetical protein